MSGVLYDSVDKGDGDGEKQPLTVKYSPSKLQMKLQKQRERVRKTQPSKFVISNNSKKSSLLSVTRLQIPKGSGYQKLDNSPLVDLQSESSEDEIFLSTRHATSARQVNKQLSRQLAKDGFQLDEMPDDEDLDLIPPSDFRSARTCTCCNAFNISCLILLLANIKCTQWFCGPE